MSDSHSPHRSTDPAIKWLVLGGVAAMIPAVVFLMYLVDSVRNVGPSGALAILGLGVVFGGAGAAVALGPIGRGIGKRLLGGGDHAAGELELEELRLQMEDLRAALTESQERLDFTERLLAGTKERIPEELH